MKRILTYFACISLVGVSFSPAIQHPVLGRELKRAIHQQVAQSSANTFDNYRKECLQRVTRQGLRGQVAQDICNCVITKFRSRYSIAQFRDLIQKSKTNKAAARTLSDVGEACFEEVLYEE
jgi:hypothetical protein